jgi:hypothetical protein
MSTSPPSPPPQLYRAHRKLHLLLPVDEESARSGPEFCKTLLSALVHGYEPTILNWDREGDRGFMQRMKVVGM